MRFRTATIALVFAVSVSPAWALSPVPPVSSSDHVRGRAGARITIIEYADFACPFCSRHHDTLKGLQTLYPRDIRWVFRHFPLTQIHPQAKPAAIAAECAARAGGGNGFWTYVDALFKSETLSSGSYGRLAGRLGLTRRTFVRCQRSKPTARAVTQDKNGGIAAGVNGVPTTFIIDESTGDTRTLVGALPRIEFERVIEEMIGPLDGDDARDAPAGTLDMGLTNDERVFGSTGALISVIEYADLQDEPSRMNHPTLKAIVEEYDGDVNWVFRHFPVTSVHPLALEAALTAECVRAAKGDDGFWAAVDGMYAGTGALTTEAIKTTASGAGVPKTSLDACLATGSGRTLIDAHDADARRTAITGVPYHFVLHHETGEVRRLPGAQSKAKFEQAINSMLLD